MRRADHSSRGVLPTVMRRCVCSINLKTEETLTRVGLQRHKKKITNYLFNNIVCDSSYSTGD